MRKLIENYKKPTPPFWRKFGDYALIAIPLLEAQFALAPDMVNPWFKWSITTALILFKAWTNTRVDKTLYQGKK